jgi:hypothetical protein
MKQTLSEINKYLTNLFKKTDDLEKLESRVNEMLIDDIIKDFTLHRAYKEKSGRYYIYEVQEDDFNHILAYLKPIQDIILPSMVIMAQKSADDYRILFRLNEDKTTCPSNYYERQIDELELHRR